MRAINTIKMTLIAAIVALVGPLCGAAAAQVVNLGPPVVPLGYCQLGASALSSAVGLSSCVRASFTGNGSGTNLTTTSVTGVILVGDAVTGSGVTAGTTIVSQTSGTAGGAGVYVTSAATTSSSASLTSGGIPPGATMVLPDRDHERRHLPRRRRRPDRERRRATSRPACRARCTRGARARSSSSRPPGARSSTRRSTDDRHALAHAIGSFKRSSDRFCWQSCRLASKLVQGQDNRVPEPADADFVVMTPIRKPRLSTNVDSDEDAAFTASISGATMNVTNVLAGALSVGSVLYGTGVSAGTTVTAFGSGSGGVGTYTRSCPPRPSARSRSPPARSRFSRRTRSSSSSTFTGRPAPTMRRRSRP